MFEILAKFFKFSGKENENKFKLSMVLGIIEALASAMKIPAIIRQRISFFIRQISTENSWSNSGWKPCR